MSAYWYHVTTSDRLDDIEDEGLGGGGARFMAWSAVSAGRNFLTASRGVPFWFDKVSEHVLDQYEADELEERSMFPVLLRVSSDELDPDLLVDDVEGTRDAYGAKAVIYEESIDPELIEVWADGKWVQLGAHPDAFELVSSYAEFSEEEYDGETWVEAEFFLNEGWQ